MIIPDPSPFTSCLNFFGIFERRRTAGRKGRFRKATGIGDLPAFGHFNIDNCRNGLFSHIYNGRAQIDRSF